MSDRSKRVRYHADTDTQTHTVEDLLLDRCPIAQVSIPILSWLPQYSRELFLKDLAAGLTVFVFLVPQGMAYAILSGLPAVYGLYSSTIPLFIYAIFATSRELAMGPMAITSLLLGVTCQRYGYEEGSAEYITVVMSLSMQIGFILIFLGLGRLGSLSNLISHSVLVGFLTASALVIAITQLKYIFGLHMPRFPYSHQVIAFILTHLGDSNANDVLLGLGMTAALLLTREWKKRNKVTNDASLAMKIMSGVANLSNFLAILLGSLVAKAIIDGGGEIRVVGEVPSGLRNPQFAIVSLPQWISMIPASCAIAFVSFAGNWAVATKYAQKNKYRVEATQELIASGLAIVIGVFFNSFVVSGGLARTAVNADSGAVTQMSMVICGLLILLSLMTLTSFFYYIPMCVLSAVIEVSVISMIDFQAMYQAYFVDRRDCLVMVITFFVTFFLGITEGLFAGIFISVAMVMKSTSFPHIVHIGRLPADEGGYYRDVRRYPEAEQIPGIAIIRMDASPIFSNCSHFKDVVKHAAEGKFHTSRSTPIHTLIIDASAWVDIDLIGLQTMHEIKADILSHGVKLAIASAKGVIRDRLRANDFTAGFSTNCFYVSLDDAVHNQPATASSKSSNGRDTPSPFSDSEMLLPEETVSPMQLSLKAMQTPVVRSTNETYSALYTSDEM